MVTRLLLILITFLSVAKTGFSQRSYKIKMGLGLNKSFGLYDIGAPKETNWYTLVSPNKLYMKYGNYKSIDNYQIGVFPWELGVEKTINEKTSLYLGYTFRYYQLDHHIYIAQDSFMIANNISDEIETDRTGGNAYTLEFRYAHTLFKTVSKEQVINDKTYSLNKKTHELRVFGGVQWSYLPEGFEANADWPPIIATTNDTLDIITPLSEKLQSHNGFISLGVSWVVNSVKKSKEFCSVTLQYSQGLFAIRQRQLTLLNTFINERIEFHSRTRGSYVSLVVAFPIWQWNQKPKE